MISFRGNVLFTYYSEFNVLPGKGLKFNNYKAKYISQSYVCKRPKFNNYIFECSNDS